LKLLAALQFLTIFPIPGRRQIGAEKLGASQGYFPLVGLFLGAILAGIDWLLGFILPVAVVNAVIIIVLVVLTGALHVDGFIDTCDGLLARKIPEERWRIMSDSRVGGFGVVGAFCLLLLVYVSLSSIAEPYRLIALILMPTLGRWSMVYAIFAFPYAKPAGLGVSFKEQAGWQGFTLATFIALVAAVGLFAIRGLGLMLVGLALMFTIWLVALAVALFLRGKFGGLTGDSYGAINEVTQVFVLIFFCIISGWC